MRKLNLEELESDFPVLDYENQKTLKGGLSINDILEAINSGRTWLDNCTFNFDNGECVSVLYEGNYIDIRGASAKDILGGSESSGGGNCVDYAYIAPAITVYPRYPTNPVYGENGNNDFLTPSWDRMGYNTFMNGDYGGGSTPSAHNVNAALSYIQSLVDQHIPYAQEYENLRTANTPEGLAYMDCSELVCRYFASIGFISNSVQAMNTLALRQYAENHPDMLARISDEALPQAGDIFLWHRSDDDGHTGIVKSYDPGTGMVTILEEYSYGDVHEAREIEYGIRSGALQAHAGWEGFYRPNIN